MAFLRDRAAQATSFSPRRAKWSAVYAKHNDERAELQKQVQIVQNQLDELIPRPKRESFVWLYERLSEG